MNRSRTGGEELDALDRRERQRVQIDTGSTGKGRTGNAAPVDEDKGIAGAETVEIEEGVLRGAVAGRLPVAAEAVAHAPAQKVCEVVHAGKANVLLIDDRHRA